MHLSDDAIRRGTDSWVNQKPPVDVVDQLPVRVPERELVGVGARTGDITNSVATTTRPESGAGTGGHIDASGGNRTRPGDGGSGGSGGRVDAGGGSGSGRGGGSGQLPEEPRVPTFDGPGDVSRGSVGDVGGGDGFGSSWPGTSRDYPRPEVTRVVDVGGKDLPGPRTPFARRADLDPNTLYRVPDRGDFYTDARGKVTYVETTYGDPKLNFDLHKPQPDTTYVVHPDITNPIPGADHTHVYVTDHRGRTVLAHTDHLAYGDAMRSESVQSRVGSEGGIGYDGGHAFGNDFGGGGEYANLKAQLASINRGAGDSFFNLEYEWRAILNRTPPGHVEVNIEFIYSGNSKVPDVSVVRYRVDGGEWERKEFFNE